MLSSAMIFGRSMVDKIYLAENQKANSWTTKWVDKRQLQKGARIEGPNQQELVIQPVSCVDQS